MSIIFWTLKLCDGILSAIDKQKIKDTGKTEAIAETLSSILKKVEHAKDITKTVDSMSDDAVNDKLRDFSR